MVLLANDAVSPLCLSSLNTLSFSKPDIFQFLTALTVMYQNARIKGSVRVTLKRCKHYVFTKVKNLDFISC